MSAHFQKNKHEKYPLIRIDMIDEKDNIQDEKKLDWKRTRD